MKHSPEPWSVSTIDPFEIWDADGKAIANFNRVSRPLELCGANLDRAVACVTACVGMPQKDVEELAAIPNGVMELTILADDYRAQRDELRAALTAILPMAENDHCGGLDTARKLELARAAIAKCEQLEKAAGEKS